MKIIFRYAILSLILATSCDEKKVFKLEEDVITSIRKNNNCLMLLDEGVQPLRLFYANLSLIRECVGNE